MDEMMCFAINPELMYTRIDEEAVLMSMSDESLYGVNRVGTEILTCLETKAMSVRSLVDHLVQMFEVDDAQCMTDTQAFLQSMLAKQLIVVS